jgi:DNA-binding GntR family transcriptional regulator
MYEPPVDELVVSELKTSQLNEQVYALLKAAIMRGSLRPGQRLSVGGLAKRFGVSATPVREALQRLSIDGLVEVSPRRGTNVSEFTRRNVQETFHTRRIIEGAAAGEVAAVSEETLQHMQAIAQEFRALRQGDAFTDYRQYIAADSEFHHDIVGLLQSSQLSEFYDRLRWAEQLVRGLAQSNYQRAEVTVAEHESILRAFQARDAEEACAAILRHLQNAEADLLRRMPAER